MEGQLACKVYFYKLLCYTNLYNVVVVILVFVLVLPS